MSQGKGKHLAIYLPSFYNGGIERAMINLSHMLIEYDIQVDFVLNTLGFPVVASQCPSQARIVDLKVSNFPSRFTRLLKYLQQEQPDTLLTAYHFTNEIALLVKRFAKTSTRVVVSEHNTISVETQDEPLLSSRHWIPSWIKLVYPWADGIVSCSMGVAEDLVKITGLPSERIKTIYNPVISATIHQKAQEKVNHTWLAPGELPVILGVGRLELQKDFANLIKAFAQVRESIPARLLILGLGSQHSQLKALVEKLELDQQVAFGGFVDNPYAYMARASVFVLSSAWEGLGNVLIEAMAVGTPVVSTDCPSGPAEILAQGKYGELVPVGDSNALAQAIVKVLSGQKKSVDSSWLQQFTLESAALKYMKILGF
ncbi:glycosyltransferase [Gloeothece verrucosa]|uniref:Glycosyl transferase group 1 n=1 Tax=Gloeothece verrucosa (strain PCC 7822) TaxID=497965 RepID=E0UCG8_GLOV7|nr:glycosyltransferase [Gloeothece verrucosa]ADN14039.1 glycosyl transferase group 1 [Gloeothece verrucosa PCC 7822]